MLRSRSLALSGRVSVAVQGSQANRQYHGHHGVTQEEFERLYAAERPLLVRQLQRTYRALSEEVEDVVQDAFQRLWSSYVQGGDSTLRDAGKWVYRVANNAMIDLARGRQVRRFTSLQEDREAATDLAPDQDDPSKDDSATQQFPGGTPLGESYEYEVNHERRRQAMLYALEKVNPEYKTLLIEFYINGKSYDELARLTGYSRGALGTTLLRARRAALQLAQEYLERDASMIALVDDS